MIVIPAEPMGMCFGVRNAIEIAYGLREPGRVTIYGQLVHNSAVARELAQIGFHELSERADKSIPETPRVLVTAHGISPAERNRLLAAGKDLVDTTCPLVRRIQEIARQLQAQGRFVIVIGRKGHVEVEGVIGGLDRYEVVHDARDVRPYRAPRIGVVMQSTVPPRIVEQVLPAIRTMNPDSEIRVVDTICKATRERQEAVRALLKRVEALVVVGGRNSNNTRELVGLAADRGRPGIHVESAEELDARWFAPFSVVGLAAGTSTPESDIRAVHAALLAMGAPAVSPAPGAAGAGTERTFRRDEHVGRESGRQGMEERTAGARTLRARARHNEEPVPEPTCLPRPVPGHPPTRPGASLSSRWPRPPAPSRSGRHPG